jgi:ribonuclease D
LAANFGDGLARRFEFCWYICWYQLRRELEISFQKNILGRLSECSSGTNLRRAAEKVAHRRLGGFATTFGGESDGMKIRLHQNDLPAGLELGPAVAIDTETLGLNPGRDRLCLVQLSSGDDGAHLVQFRRDQYAAPNLKRLLADPKVLKLYHFARFDLATMRRYLGVMGAPVYCTRTASKLARTYTDKHGLKDLVKELLEVELSKQQQSSDWGAETLTEQQLAYAANDVAYLHRLKDVLDRMLKREGRMELAQACFDFLPARAELDLAGWGEGDIFAH